MNLSRAFLAFLLLVVAMIASIGPVSAQDRYDRDDQLSSRPRRPEPPRWGVLSRTLILEGEKFCVNAGERVAQSPARLQ